MIKVLAEIIRDSFPETDLTYRWGGEEFIVILPKTSNIRAYNLAENLRKIVEASSKFKGNTVSIGLATCKGDVTVSKFFDQADKAMYQAKVTRNRVHNVGLITE